MSPNRVPGSDAGGTSFGAVRPDLPLICLALTLILAGCSSDANPLDAHTAYDYDDRVIAMMAHGIGHDGSAQIVKDRCTWLETDS